MNTVPEQEKNDSGVIFFLEVPTQSVIVDHLISRSQCAGKEVNFRNLLLDQRGAYLIHIFRLKLSCFVITVDSLSSARGRTSVIPVVRAAAQTSPQLTKYSS